MSSREDLDWTGKIVVRLLPSEDDVDFEAKKPILRTPIASVPSFGDTKQPSEEKICLLPTEYPTHFFPSPEDSQWTKLDIYLNQEETVHIQMNRKSDETIGKTFTRMAMSISKKMLKKRKQSKSGSGKQIRRENPTVSFSFWKQSSSDVDHPPDERTMRIDVDDNQLLGQLWSHVLRDNSSVVMELIIDNNGTTARICLGVECCLPTVRAVKTFGDFASRVFVGIPLVVETKAFFATHTTVNWFVNGACVCTNDPCYTPKDDDVGKALLVVITPHRTIPADTNKSFSGYPEAYRFENNVEERPQNAILSMRPEFTTVVASEDCLRVLSYNILSEGNAFSEMAQTSFYPYCDAEILDRKRRLPLVVHEILAYHADIICLQEVDNTVFHRLLRPVLEKAGKYRGYYTPKEGKREGCAMFWSPKCEMIKSSSHLIQDLMSGDDWNNHIMQSLRDDENLLHVLSKLSHVLQISTLRVGSTTLLVANTHLFFHPRASHIRLLQAAACCFRLAKERQQGGSSWPIVFCGDFNSTPTSGAARFLWSRNYAGEQEADTTWRHLHTFTWGENDSNKGKKPTVKIPTISLPDAFPQLISGYPEHPTFTHYIQGFSGTLDYILASNDFIPVACGRMPTEEVIKKDVAMPSKVTPSDHVCLVCDLKYHG